jgi:Uma2 family endonuclease
MIAKPTVPEQEFLATPYEHEAEWVDGEIRERGVPDLIHSIVQTNLVGFGIRQRAQGQSMLALAELRVRTTRGYRTPDVSIFYSHTPAKRVPELPPDIAVEIISRDDRYHDLMEKVREYFASGVSQVWVIEPYLRALSQGPKLEPVERFTIPELGIELTPDEIFAGVAEIRD